MVVVSCEALVVAADLPRRLPVGRPLLFWLTMFAETTPCNHDGEKSACAFSHFLDDTTALKRFLKTEHHAEPEEETDAACELIVKEFLERSFEEIVAPAEPIAAEGKSLFRGGARHCCQVGAFLVDILAEYHQRGGASCCHSSREEAEAAQ